MIKPYLPVLNEFKFIHLLTDNVWVYPGFPIVFVPEKLELHYMKDTKDNNSVQVINDEYVNISYPEELRSMIHAILVMKS